MDEFPREPRQMAVIGRGTPFLVGSVALLATIALRAAPQVPVAPAQAPVAAPSAASDPPSASPAVDFAKDVQPILEKHCYECHGTKKVKGRLRLHSPAFIAKGGENGPVIVAGDPEHSLMMRRVLGLD